MVGCVPVLVLHGGSEVIAPGKLDRDREDAIHAGLAQALRAGLAQLADGGSALDAVTEAVKALEDDPLFNAGRGSVFTADGGHEMDAAIMDGRDRSAGAIGGICGPRHPILAARAVMETTDHIFLAGAGAARFCRDVGLEHQESRWFDTEFRRAALEEELARRRANLADDGDDSRKPEQSAPWPSMAWATLPRRPPPAA